MTHAKAGIGTTTNPIVKALMRGVAPVVETPNEAAAKRTATAIDPITATRRAVLALPVVLDTADLSCR